ncbi:hypothetical protein DPMN_029512 [Dreissena polymorpha]|uniref:Uncharacterized protein n=1 Tax=Dreissena polymorpha TaxID=45954 RepID=A0A9D4LZA6_DREPO|nr:hypothetical protein DPMN_029512 [Dreissena polymorpha]
MMFNGSSSSHLDRFPMPEAVTPHGLKHPTDKGYIKYKYYYYYYNYYYYTY